MVGPDLVPPAPPDILKRAYVGVGGLVGFFTVSTTMPKTGLECHKLYENLITSNLIFGELWASIWTNFMQ